MKRRILLLLCASLYFSSSYAAENIIWSGEVSSRGEPTAAIPLTNHKKYLIKVKGFVNLGKWIQNKEALASDACYEFSQSGKAEKMETFKNNHDIPVCDDKYNPDHYYESEPFIAKQNRIFFWLNDGNYDDNSGALHVQLVELD